MSSPHCYPLANSRAFRIGLLCLLGVGLCTISFAKRFTILVNAEADDAYMEKSEKLEYQTYHFVRGKFYDGYTRDPKLENEQFEDIARSVADALKKRDYYPEPDKMKGDLLIMVSWGRTTVDPDLRELMGIDSAADTISASGQDQASAGVGGAGDGLQQAIDANNLLSSAAEMVFKHDITSNRATNVALLGLGKDLSQAFNMAVPRDQLWDALEEERYFIVLNAFDYQHLLNQKELKEVWSARYSTRARGIGFRDAYESMNVAVSGVLGLKLDKLANVKGDTNSTIEMGELEVVETADDEKDIAP